MTNLHTYRLYTVAIVILATAWLMPVYGQNAATADKLFLDGEYAQAQEQYQQLLRKNPTSPLYLYRYARCAQEQGDYNTAILYFNKAGDKYPLKYLYLGDIYMQLWYMEQAVEAYNTYLRLLKTPSGREDYVRKQIQQAEKYQRYLRRVEKVHILDSLETTLDSLIYVCVLSAEAGKLTTDSTGTVIYTNQRADRRLWTTTNDSSSYIVSNQRLLDQWTKPDTLPPTINRSSKQTNPFMLSDGVTLYFASNDSNGLGGYDIYVSRYNTTTGNYTTPENLGLPYNSNANDYMMIIDETRHIGYFATDRSSELGRVKIYSFLPQEQKTYWRNIPADSLIAYARLRYILQADKKDIDTTGTTLPNTQQLPAPSIRFALNDSVIYHSLDDFQSDTARQLYQQWQTAWQTLQESKNYLQQLRQQYYNGNTDKRNELAPVILRIEREIPQQTILCMQLLNTVRRTELETLSKRTRQEYILPTM